MHDLIIIGAGPAGLTAALYAGRYKLDTVVMEKLVAGGQILLSTTIDNYPGFPGGIATDQLIDSFKKQVADVGISIRDAEAVKIEVERGQRHHSYTVFTAAESFKTKSIIVASGASWKRLGIPGEHPLIGRGVSFCGTCDGPLFRNKEIVVVGGGDKAIGEAIFLSAYASKVTVVHRRQEFRAAQVLMEKVKAVPKIEFLLDAEVAEIKGSNRVEAVTIHDIKTGTMRELVCQGVFIFIGISPNTTFIKKDVDTDENGFIITDNSMKSSLHGVFACGDCRQKSLYQVVSACGEGAVACHSVHTYLLNK
jgi:thioredoxin reductase (NADPH)